MKHLKLKLLTGLVLCASSSAYASAFDGYYFGGKVGFNTSDVTGAQSASKEMVLTAGIEQGYNWEIQNFLVGGSFFADFNPKKDRVNVTSEVGSVVYGLDLKLGMPRGNSLPYVKLGWAVTNGKGSTIPAGSFRNEDGFHWGVGYEYKFTPNWSLVTELSGSNADNGSSEYDNNSLTVGMNYYFGKPAPVVAQAPAAPAPAPVIAPKAVEPAPVVAPAPVVVTPAPAPKETWKTLLEEKPITIEGAHFDTASHQLKPVAKEKLSEVVEFASTYKDATLDVAGHTDSVGKDDYNQKLSERRAGSVKKFLVDHGVAADRIKTNAYGETQPIADNNTVEGRAKNRRVEIRSKIVEEKKVKVNE